MTDIDSLVRRAQQAEDELLIYAHGQVPPPGDDDAPGEVLPYTNGGRPLAPSSGDPPPLEFKRYADLRAEVRGRGQRRFLIRGIWPAGSYGVHAAEAKAQKSWNVLDLAVAVATGGAWLGRYPIDDPGPVVIFWGEGDDADLVRRLDAISEHRGVDPDTLDIVTCCRVPHLGRDEHLDLFRGQVAHTRPRLVILDPLYLAARGADSRDLYAMGAFLEPAQHICQAVQSALIVVTHFNRKDGRGAMRITGAGPAEWGRVLIAGVVQSRATDAATEETTVVTELDVIGGSVPDRTIRVVRRVRADDPADLDSPLHVHVEVTETDGSPETSELTPAEAKMHEALVALADEAKPVTRQALVDHIAAEHGHGLKRETASRALNRLAELGLCDGAQPTKGVAKLWWPTDSEVPL